MALNGLGTRVMRCPMIRVTKKGNAKTDGLMQQIGFQDTAC